MNLNTADLKSKLQGEEIVIAPGIYDALSASIAHQSGFDTVYLSGASIAYTKLGRPDIGLTGSSEVADTLRYIRERNDVSVIVDGDTGFGNAINTARTVRMFEAAGANAIQLEDQTYPKRCGHLRGKTLVSKGEMAGKISAAVDARRSENTLIIGRTDGLAVENLDATLERAHAFKDAGADVLFIEGIRSDEEISAILKEFKGKIPLMINMVEGGDTPIQDAETLQKLGFSMVIFPGALVRAYTHMAQRFFSTLKQDGTTDAFRPNMLDFKQLNEFLGTEKILEQGKKYEF